MKTNTVGLVIMLCACLPVSLSALAQQGMVMPPPAAQAIESHLQQTRIREQRDAMETKKTVPVTQRQAAHSQPKNPVAAKPKEAPSAIQDLDGEALFDRPGQVRTDSKSRGRQTK